jgi:membrane protein
MELVSTHPRSHIKVKDYIISIPTHIKNLLGSIKRTAIEWYHNDAQTQAAALAYYTTFSIAPLLIIAIAVAGFLFGEEAARGQVQKQLLGLVGPNGATVIESMMKSTQHTDAGILATLLGIFVLLFGATGAFAQMQSAINFIWQIKPKSVGARGFLRTRFLSFGLVLGIGFLLLVSLVLSAVLAALGSYVTGFMPAWVVLIEILNVVFTFAAITVLFAMIYKFLPDAKILWRDVWLGSIMTSLFFTLGKTAIGLYLGRSAVSSAYGAAGALAIVLLWVYYSSQILLFGAQFTKVYAQEHGGFSGPEPHQEAAAPVPKHAETQP